MIKDTLFPADTFDLGQFFLLFRAMKLYITDFQALFMLSIRSIRLNFPPTLRFKVIGVQVYCIHALIKLLNRLDNCLTCLTG
jgi:hypothetical protein